MSGTGNTQSTGKNEYSSGVASLFITKEYIEDQIKNNWPDLDLQYKGFSHEYLLNGYNHRKAATKIGRSANAGIKIIRKPLVSAYVAYLQDTKLESSLVRKDFIEARLDDLYDMAIGDVKVPLVTGMGESFKAKKFNGGLALQVLQEKSKMNSITQPEVNGSDILNAFAQAVRGNVPSQHQE